MSHAAIKKLVGITSTILVSQWLSAQSLDTMTLVNEKKLAVKVIEEGPQSVGYKIPGDDILHKINRMNVIKISYANGKSDESPLLKIPPMASPKDWPLVKIVEGKDELEGVYKVDDLLVNGNPFSERGKTALKMATAMGGGNIVEVMGLLPTSTGYTSYPVSQHSRNSIYVSSPNRMRIQSIARIYNSHPYDSISFVKLMLLKPELRFVSQEKLRGIYRMRMRTTDFHLADFRIVVYSIENGNFFVHVKLPGIVANKFRVNYFDEGKIVLSYKSGWRQKLNVLTFFIKPEKLASIKIN